MRDVNRNRSGYIRLMKAGPSRKEQEMALQKAGIVDFSENGRVYVEPAQRPSTSAEKKYASRSEAIRALIPGDELVIASPAILGVTLADALEALASITAKGAGLYVVSVDTTVRWQPEASSAIKFAEQVVSDAAVLRAKHARQARGKDALGGRKPKLIAGTKTFLWVESVWRDAKKSAAEVAAETGYSPATLYRVFGAKGTPRFGDNRGRKPKSKSRS